MVMENPYIHSSCYSCHSNGANMVGTLFVTCRSDLAPFIVFRFIPESPRFLVAKGLVRIHEEFPRTFA